ncbi:MAG: response regulator [Pirellulales bacterium]
MSESIETRGVVYVVEDDADLRQSIEWILRSVGYDVMTFGAADEFLLRLEGKNAACLVVDLLLPGMTGLKLCREIVRRKLICSFVMISGHGDVPSTVEAMRLGAVDFLEKPFSHQELLTAVDLALATSRAIQNRFEADAEAGARLATLTPREQQIFEAVCDGLVSKEIAKRLGISSRTVDVHRSRIMEKLKIESHTQLAHLIAAAYRRRETLMTPKAC